jgi:hypothetical protein
MVEFLGGMLHWCWGLFGGWSLIVPKRVSSGCLQDSKASLKSPLPFADVLCLKVHYLIDPSRRQLAATV